MESRKTVLLSGIRSRAGEKMVEPTGVKGTAVPEVPNASWEVESKGRAGKGVKLLWQILRHSGSSKPYTPGPYLARAMFDYHLIIRI